MLLLYLYALKLTGDKIMKSNTLLLTLILFAFTYSLSAFSESKICINPVKAICSSEEAKDVLKQKSEKVSLILKQIRENAKKNAAGRIAELKKKFPDRRDHNKIEGQKKVIYFQEMVKLGEAHAVGVETIVKNAPIVAYLKNFMKVAIDETNFDEVTKHNLKFKIDAVIIGNFSDFIKRTGLNDNNLPYESDSCGYSGLIENAFATTINGRPYVLICPGFQVSIYENPNMQERINSILSVLSHEMGHHIDLRNMPIDPYLPYLNCNISNYANHLAKIKEVDVYCKTNTIDKCNTQKVLTHADEMIADAWANKVLAIYARGQQFSVVQTENLIKSSMRDMCGSGDEGIHPSGNLRMNILRLTPEIAYHLRCDNYDLRVRACTFDGQVKLRNY